MTGVQTLKTIAVLMPGDMGHGCGQSLARHGFRIVTSLAGRSRRTKGLSAKAEIENLPNLGDVVREADLILSIIPPQHAFEMAKKISALMTDINRYPDYADCNAVSPATAEKIAGLFYGIPANFIDASIIGLNPVKEEGRTRLYVSGPDLCSVFQMDQRGLTVKTAGPLIGQASALKMLYAGATKGMFSLFAAVAVTAEAAALRQELFDEFAYSRPDILSVITRMVTRIPADAGRWASEMEEIAATFSQYGMTPKFHEGAAALMRTAGQTPLAKHTRETLPDNIDLAEALKMYLAALGSTD